LHTKNLVDLSKMHQSKVVLCAFGDVLSLVINKNIILL
jgi:hypothetical protein